MIEASLRLARGDFTLDVALQLPARGVSVLFGASGCGKTTVLRAIAGLERAAGRVALDDEVWQDDAQARWRPTHERALGYVIQEAALFPHLDVQANLAYGQRRSARRSPHAPASAALQIESVIALLGIGSLLKRRPDTLSGGERQRVAIARALASAPRLLLMDEPLAALDGARKAEILPYLERLQRSLALPIVYVTHAMDEVARLADHLVLLDAGRVRAAGPLAELLARPGLPLARQDDAGVVLQAVVAAHDPADGLSQLKLAGLPLWVGQTDAAPGETVRVRVLARDVSVSRLQPQQTSVLNVLPALLDTVQAEHGSALLRLRLDSALADPQAPVWLLARITRRSCQALALQPGDRLFAQIKGVALMR